MKKILLIFKCNSKHVHGFNFYFNLLNGILSVTYDICIENVSNTRTVLSFRLHDKKYVFTKRTL